jgi:hypothetical protein
VRKGVTDLDLVLDGTAGHVLQNVREWIWEIRISKAAASSTVNLAPCGMCWLASSLTSRPLSICTKWGGYASTFILVKKNTVTYMSVCVYTIRLRYCNSSIHRTKKARTACGGFAWLERQDEGKIEAQGNIPDSEKTSFHAFLSVR